MGERKSTLGKGREVTDGFKDFKPDEQKGQHEREFLSEYLAKSPNLNDPNAPKVFIVEFLSWKDSRSGRARKFVDKITASSLAATVRRERLDREEHFRSVSDSFVDQPEARQDFEKWNTLAKVAQCAAKLYKDTP